MRCVCVCERERGRERERARQCGVSILFRVLMFIPDYRSLRSLMPLRLRHFGIDTDGGMDLGCGREREGR